MKFVTECPRRRYRPPILASMYSSTLRRTAGGTFGDERIRLMTFAEGPVHPENLIRALVAASPDRIRRALPCRAESPREGQCPAVPAGYQHPPRRPGSMLRTTGRAPALLSSGGSVRG